AFYQELTSSGYIDTAVVEARREVDRRDPSHSEWVIPVLYLQSKDPRLFRPVASSHAGLHSITSPFFTGGRINEPELFFGRQRIVREICAELRKGCSVSIVGDSQIGKSSLLYYLYQTRADWLPRGTIEYIDLQCVLDEADFCETVLRKVGESGDSLRDLKRALASREIILLLDEVERLAEDDFNPRLHDLLRSLAQEPHFAMCLATERPLVDLFPARTPGGVSPFHNIFTVKTLGPFTESEARSLIADRLANTHVTFTEREIERLLTTSHYHPARLQAEAKALFEVKMP
ncbi:MAG TPA: ATP-binding protein, partial [Anaerolineae bacterium]|nr:ATP-binding protein [Anaerolineae bacterium]